MAELHIGILRIAPGPRRQRRSVLVRLHDLAGIDGELAHDFAGSRHQQEIVDVLDAGYRTQINYVNSFAYLHPQNIAVRFLLRARDGLHAGHLATFDDPGRHSLKVEHELDLIRDIPYVITAIGFVAFSYCFARDDEGGRMETRPNSLLA